MGACVALLVFVWENSDRICLLPRDRWVLDDASKMGCPFAKKQLEVKCTSSSWSRSQDSKLSHKGRSQQLSTFWLQGILSWVSDSLDQSTPWLPFSPHAWVFLWRKPQHWGKEDSVHWGLFPAWRQNTSKTLGKVFYHSDKTHVLRNISPVWKAI